MYRTSAMGRTRVAAVLVMIAMTSAVAGCGGARDAQPDFGQSSITDKTYHRGQLIDSEKMPAATGGNGTLTYTITPDLPAGLFFDAAIRLLSGTPMAAQPATLYTYTAIDSDPANPDSASLTFTITVEAVASVTIAAGEQEVDEGADHTPIDVTLTLSEPVTGEVAIDLAVTGTARPDSDFDLADTVVVVAEGATEATTTITPIRDLEAEGNETITLEIDSIAGSGEIGPTSSVNIVIRDLGAPPQADYPDFLAILSASEAIEDSAITFEVKVFNLGAAAASSTRAVLVTVTAETAPRRLASLAVNPLGPNDWFAGTVRVPFSELVPGTNNYFVLRVAPVPEEDPAVIASVLILKFV